MKGTGFARTLNRLRHMAYIDVGGDDATVFVSGMGRSGTTWVASLINHKFDHRVVFEPFRPAIVPAANVFGPFAYVRPTDADPARREAAERILSGRTPRGSVDRLHRGFIFRRRIIKGVRTNLMLGWLKALRPSMPLVLIIRNPFAVAASWLRLGWGKVADGSTAELDVILQHRALREDFPGVDAAVKMIDRGSAFECALAQWSLLHLVPLAQLRDGAAHVVFFEDLLIHPAGTFDRLAQPVGITVDRSAFERVVGTAAETDFLQRGNGADREQILGDWQQHLTPAQVERGIEILAAFGLGQMYDGGGRPTGLTPMRPGS